MNNIGIGDGDCDPSYDEAEHYCPKCNNIMVEGWVDLNCTVCDHTETGEAPEPKYESAERD
jgi:hypothetical protein